MTLWYCRDISRQIYPLKLLFKFDVKVVKGGWQKISIINLLMSIIKRASIIVNITLLLVNYCTPWKSIELYNTVNHLFVLPALNENRRYKSIVWKNYQNQTLKIKGVLVEEQHTNQL